MNINFQSSYTLDLLNFIDLLLIEGSSELSDDVEHFREFLSHDGDSSLLFLQKTLKHGQSLQQLVAPLLLADPEFSRLSLAELLVSGRYLVNTYKGTPAYGKASLSYQRFLQKEAVMVVASLEPLVRDLERGGFKHYWLTTHLPMLNICLQAYKDRLDWKGLGAVLGAWSQNPIQIYVSPMAKPDFIHYGNQHYVATYEPACRRIARQLIETTVEEAVSAVSWGHLMAKIPQKEEIRKVKVWGQGVGDYVKKSARMSLELLLKEQAGLIADAGQHLLNMEKGSYQLALLMYEYMQHAPKKELDMAEYLLGFFQNVDISGLHEVGKLKIA